MLLRVIGTSLHSLRLPLRMPFKYGIATLTELPHLFLRAQVHIDGVTQLGVAAENLPPKWFTKDPQTSLDQDIAGMLEVIRSACRIAEEAPACASVFEFWKHIYDTQKHWAETTTYPPLLWSFSVSLVERAVIDAFCRASGQSFAGALRANTFGIRLGELHPELDAAPASFLPKAPLRKLIVRHTVGLADPLTEAEIAPGERLEDGLPQSLEACTRAYGLTHFKIKLGGDVDRDAGRLRDIARVLPDDDRVRFTLDGNENYRDVDSLRRMWERVTREAFIRRMIVLEQPLHRDVALSHDTARALAAWSDRPAMIIDESDDQLDSAPRALAAGYVGTSYKSCKGVFKGIANACLMARRSAKKGAMITAEDLSTVGPVSLMQDLAVVASLGISHVERNGHHYFRGLSTFDSREQQQVLRAHADLYRDAGFPTLRITGGAIEVGSVVDAPFGVAFSFDPINHPVMNA